eukprot:TRINITY_DN3689_c0_g2_i1.p1 TRINITY_DN3689_c0_g2~~TRINITY_DN3689_c0_g2_i1.p1  ORF type:complete len:1081 (+),score=249.30 TRINITY_DN3689_c0_g2_i1:69-3311(+)
MSDSRPTLEVLLKGEATLDTLSQLRIELRAAETRTETLSGLKANDWEALKALARIMYTDGSDEFKSEAELLLGNVEAAEAVLLVHPVPADTTSVEIEDPRPNSNITVRVTDSSTFVEVVQNDKLLMTCDDLHYNGIDTVIINSGFDSILPHDKLGYTLGCLKAILRTEEVNNNIPTVVDVSKGYVFYTDRIDRINQYMQFTGLSEEESERRLRENRYNLELAMSFYFEYGEGSGNTAEGQAQQVAGTEFEASHFDPSQYGAPTRRKRRPPTQSKDRAAYHLVTRKYVARLILNQYYTLKQHVDPKGSISSLSMTTENNAADWTVKMRFPPDSSLQKQLTAYAQGIQDESADCLVICVRFSAQYPSVPPELTLKNPRLKYLSAAVSFGGRIAHGALTPSSWNSDCEISSILKDVHSMFERSTAEICKDTSHIRGYDAHDDDNLFQRLETTVWPTENNFDGQYTCHSSETSLNEFGVFLSSDFDRIVLPADAANRIYGGNAVVLPLIFEITAPNGRKRHCGTSTSNGFEPFLPSGHVIVPDWIFRDLFLTDNCSVRIRCVELPPISFVKLQPHSKTFYRDAALCDSTQASLQRGLKGMAALTEDTTVAIMLQTTQGDIPHHFEVVKIEPAAAARLIAENPDDEIEFKVDFTAAPDHEEDEDRASRMREQAKRLQAVQQKQREKAERLANSKKLRYEKLITGFRNLIKEGSVEVSFKMPDGETIRGKFPEGEDTRMLYAFVACNSKWAQCKHLLPHQIELATMFPRKIIEVGAIDKTYHRAMVAASEGGEKEGLERLDTLTSSNMGSRLYSMVSASESDSDFDCKTDVIINTTANQLIGSSKQVPDDTVTLGVVNANGLSDKDYKERSPLRSKVSPFEILQIIDRRHNFMKISHSGREFHIRDATVTEISRTGLEALAMSSVFPDAVDEPGKTTVLGKGLFALLAADKVKGTTEQVKTAPSKVKGYIFGSDNEESSSSDSDEDKPNPLDEVSDDDDSLESESTSDIGAPPPPPPPPRGVPPPPVAAPQPPPPPPAAANPQQNVDEDELNTLLALCPHVDRDTAREILASCLSVTAAANILLGA